MGCGSSKDESDLEPEDARQPTFHKSLTSLSSVPTLYMHQDLPDNIAVCCKGNTYTLEDHKGLLRFRAEEESFCNTCCGRWWCGPSRGFTIRVTDAETDDFVLSAERAACRCDWWCCVDCCLCAHRMIVRDAQGEFIGRVIQKLSCGPRFSVENEVQDSIAIVRGPACTCRCCCDQIFNILTPHKTGNADGEEEEEMKLNGHLIKRWETGKFVETQPESVTDVDTKEKKGRYYNMDHEHTQVIFPENTDDNNKALILGAFFLVNYMYFEMS